MGTAAAMEHLCRFVQARIEEQEQRSLMWLDEPADGSGAGQLVARDEHALAQTRAFRRIVALVRAHAAHPEGCVCPRSLSALAAIWADHDDYDSAWQLTD
jgi:Family of unknown function (DUF6221)